METEKLVGKFVQFRAYFNGKAPKQRKVQRQQVKIALIEAHEFDGITDSKELLEKIQKLVGDKLQAELKGYKDITTDRISVTGSYEVHKKDSMGFDSVETLLFDPENFELGYDLKDKYFDAIRCSARKMGVE